MSSKHCHCLLGPAFECSARCLYTRGDTAQRHKEIAKRTAKGDVDFAAQNPPPWAAKSTCTPAAPRQPKTAPPHPKTNPTQPKGAKKPQKGPPKEMLISRPRPLGHEIKIQPGSAKAAKDRPTAPQNTPNTAQKRQETTKKIPKGDVDYAAQTPLPLENKWWW